MQDLLLKLQVLLRNFALQVTVRVLTQGAIWLAAQLNDYKLVDDGMQSQLTGVLPFILASVLIETLFSYLQRKWNLLQIDVARGSESTMTRGEVRERAVEVLQEQKASKENSNG